MKGKDAMTGQGAGGTGVAARAPASGHYEAGSDLRARQGSTLPSGDSGWPSVVAAPREVAGEHVEQADIGTRRHSRPVGDLRGVGRNGASLGRGGCLGRASDVLGPVPVVQLEALEAGELIGQLLTATTTERSRIATKRLLTAHSRSLILWVGAGAGSPARQPVPPRLGRGPYVGGPGGPLPGLVWLAAMGSTRPTYLEGGMGPAAGAQGPSHPRSSCCRA